MTRRRSVPEDPVVALEPADVYVATSSGVVKVGGTIHRYYRGRTRVRAGHPLLSAVPGRFAPDRILAMPETA